ncbi:site-specific integrase [Altererythrobacter sp. TH136]|uniref:tyrosine-type recombinase/integrase n=1 Tax=Altererythrobacter sp. TH136 TaxID=2067415 RepID=UPI0011648504|nr:site-specific integrase [Altererythrobacter sp. TH136]QDM40389.1 site-specific integrase [Altererythrobacter sp. TH136]
MLSSERLSGTGFYPHEARVEFDRRAFRSVQHIDLLKGAVLADPFEELARSGPAGLWMPFTADRGVAVSPQNKAYACPFPRRTSRHKTGGPKRARVLADADIIKVLAHVEASNSPASDRAKVLLSCKAGLRAGEIAELRRHAFTDARGKVGSCLTVYSSKTGSTREVPIHPMLRDALDRLITAHPRTDRVAFNARHGRIRPQNAKSVTVWFLRLYRELGLMGCSSHSGRRTFATRAARACGAHHASLADVQRLLGHSQLTSTECYLDFSAGTEALVHAI